MGLVVRDNEGNVIAAASIPCDRLVSPAHAEILAVLFALQFARDLELSQFVLESDCVSMVRAINASDEDRSSLGDFISCAKAGCQSVRCHGLFFVPRK